MNNNSSEERNVMTAITAHSCYYTGTIHEKISKVQGNIILAPGEEKVSLHKFIYILLYFSFFFLLICMWIDGPGHGLWSEFKDHAFVLQYP